MIQVANGLVCKYLIRSEEFFLKYCHFINSGQDLFLTAAKVACDIQ